MMGVFLIGIITGMITGGLFVAAVYRHNRRQNSRKHGFQEIVRHELMVDDAVLSKETSDHSIDFYS